MLNVGLYWRSLFLSFLWACLCACPRKTHSPDTHARKALEEQPGSPPHWGRPSRGTAFLISSGRPGVGCGDRSTRPTLPRNQAIPLTSRLSRGSVSLLRKHPLQWQGATGAHLPALLSWCVSYRGRAKRVGWLFQIIHKY